MCAKYENNSNKSLECSLGPVKKFRARKIVTLNSQALKMKKNQS